MVCYPTRRPHGRELVCLPNVVPSFLYLYIVRVRLVQLIVIPIYNSEQCIMLYYLLYFVQMASVGDDRQNDQTLTGGVTTGQDGGQDGGGVNGVTPAATITSDANSQSGQNHISQAPLQQNYQNYGYNNGQQNLPNNNGQHNLGNMQNQHVPQQHHNYQHQQNQFQPSAAQPLAYPNYGGFMGQQNFNPGQYNPGHFNPHQFNPYFNQHAGYMPLQNQMPPPPPPPQYQAFAPPAPPPPQAAATQQAAAPSTYAESVTDNGSDQGEEELFTGQLSDKLDEWMAQVKQKPTEAPPICTKLASYMTYQLEQGFCTADLDYSIKEYPPIKNVPLAWAPELEPDIFSHTRFQNNKSVVATEVALKSIQRGIASSLNALGPLSEIIMRQSENNPALDDASTAILDIIKLLSNSLGGITKKRRDLLKPAIDSKYHQRLGKKDEDFNAKFLFGGSVSDRVRKFKAADSLMKEVMKSDPKTSNSSSGQRRSQHASSSNGGGHQTSRSSNRSQPYNKPSGSGHSRSNNNSKPRQDFRKGGPHQNNNNNNNSGRNHKS